jgi:hypothetical protein
MRLYEFLDTERVQHFARYGFDCFVIWEHDIDARNFTALEGWIDALE